MTVEVGQTFMVFYAWPVCQEHVALCFFLRFRSDFWHVDICVVLGLNGQ
jgi:hypothetical protein